MNSGLTKQEKSETLESYKKNLLQSMIKKYTKLQPDLIKIKNMTYDQFYDEHVYVFSIISISNLAKKSGLRIFDCEKIDNHGGSMRYYLCKFNSNFNETERFKKQIKEEFFLKLNKISTYKKFSKRVLESKKKLVLG